MNTVKLMLGKKIKAIRLGEGLTGKEFAQILEISIDSLKNYETERRTISEQNLLKITNHPRFKKYSLWLMTDQTAPEIGQVSPDIETEGSRATG